jgi:hypothetical protein
MARARNIKPGFCTNEDLAECSFEARLCFALLPMLADREGRLEDRPKRIKGELFRFDSLDVEPLLAELERYGFIARYEVNGLRLIQILAFGKHQNPHHREPESTLPTHPSLRLDPDGKYVKPEAGAPLDALKAPDKPEASPGLSPPRDDLARGSSRADSGFRSPDTGTLIPDSGLFAEAPPAPPPPARPAKPSRPKAAEPEKPKTADVWEAYRSAYAARYGVDPLRNLKVNGVLSNLLKRIPVDEAPAVARFFVGSEDKFYVNAGHPVDLLLRDCEKLRTATITGQRGGTPLSRHTGFDQRNYEGAPDGSIPA